MEHAVVQQALGAHARQCFNLKHQRQLKVAVALQWQAE